jgi:hypothetical protein
MQRDCSRKPHLAVPEIPLTLNSLAYPPASVPPPETEGVLAGVDVSVIMPCLNESATVGPCVTKDLQPTRQLSLNREVIVGTTAALTHPQKSLVLSEPG